MENTNEASILLSELGFKGKSLRDLESVIQNEIDFEKFRNFIILNEGKFKSKLQIVHQYKLHLMENSTYSITSFISEYMSSNSKERKRKVVEKLVGQHVTIQSLDKIESYIEEGYMTLEQFYHMIEEYRADYSLETMLNLVKSSKKNLAIMFKRIVGLSAKTLMLSVGVRSVVKISDFISFVA